ncbi:MAG: hypothetical protein M1834_003696, partial [Cirrosporium novae-zelandiae]
MKLQAIGLGALLASTLAAGNENAQVCKKTKVAVLGAGVAGITAAQALVNQSITDFVIIEYQNDIGGRLHKVNFGKKPNGSSYTVEAGANWIQGLDSPSGRENPIYTLAKKYNIYNIPSDFGNITTFDQNGPIDYTDLVDTFSDVWDNVSIDAGSILQNNGQDRSIRAGARLMGWNPRQNDSYSQVAEWWTIDSEFIYTPDESSEVFTAVANNATFQYFSDENNFVIDQRGFSAMIKGEAFTFLKKNDTRLHLNTIVTGISYSDTGVTVQTNRGCIEAEYAIMTFSIGVLQNGGIDFQPALPSWKQAAISSFDLGTYTKIFLQFDEPFWDSNTQFLLYADPYERGRYPSFQPLDVPNALPGSGIIVCTVVNKQSYRVEAQPDEVTKAEIMEVLRNMYGKNISDPVDFYVPRWTQVPWAFGSFSNWPPSTSLATHQNFRANIGRLFFAGEATSQEFFGYLHGAWFEGHNTGQLIGSCIRGTTNCTNAEGETHYSVLTGVTPYD